MKKTIIFLSINLLITIGFVNSSNAQINVDLRLDESAKSFFGASLFCDKNYNCGLLQNEQSKTSEFGDEGLQIKVRRADKDFYLLADTNRNKDLTDEKEILLKNASGVIVRIQKKTESGKTLDLPFAISHNLSEGKGVNVDSFIISPHYVVAGILSYKNCSSKIALSDMNLDGEFSLADGERGTNLHIDRNNDGSFLGREEHKKTNEIIDFCGQNFLVSALNGSVLTLSPTDLKIAKVGEEVPKFSIILLNGESFSSDKLKGKLYVLDFWASWCARCVKNLPQINLLKNDYKDRLSVFSVNVDEPAQKALAEKIISENGLFDFSVVRGLGEDDPFWKTFGGANLNKLSIPLYVLVDKEGIVRYADNGGTDLIELRKSIEKLYSNR
jgi:thiol-disulfide isomerase/thioredoxin